MSSLQSSAIIATLLKETPKPVLLLGAGASVTSGIPLAGEVVSKAAKFAYARQSGKDPDDPRITRSDWYPWLLESHSWFREDIPQANLFPYAVEYLLQPRKTRKDFWIKVLNPDVPVSIGYVRLLELMHLQKITNILTANFDECITKARNEINRPHHIDIIKAPSDYTKISSTPTYPSAIYLHGAVENYTDKNVINEVEHMDSDLVQNLIPLIKDYPLIVVGYRGAEASIMQDLLLNNIGKTFNYKNGIYWCLRKGEKIEDVPDFVKQLSQAIGSNFQFVEIESFDHLFDKVIWSHLEEQKLKINPIRTLTSNLQIEQEIKNFDLKNAKTYEDTDFEKSLLRLRIINYCNRLNIKVPERIEDSWLYEQMIYLNLIRIDLEHISHSTNAGLLLFSKNPQIIITSSQIIIKFIGDNSWIKKIINDQTFTGEVFENIISGNLWNQLNEVTNALALINKPFRLKNEKSENVLPYDPIALKEVIVNSFVHRDYEIDQPNIIEIYSGKIVIKNPGGLIDEVKPYFEDEGIYEEIKKGRRGIKGYRNPALADLFYSSGDMDKKGSGLYDVITRVQRNAGYVNFYNNIDNAAFTVEMWCRPEAVDEITNTASTLSIITTKFSSNIIEIKELPDSIYFAPSLYKKAREIFDTYENIYFPPFNLYGNYVYSFSNLRNASNTLRNIVNTSDIDRLSLDEFTGQDEGEKRLSWLINDYLKSYMYRLGLIVDKERKRAYFPKTNEGERIVSYQARFKKAKRTIVRPRYSANKEKIRYWEHKAFNYTIKRFDNEWGIMIEPTYVFTIDGERFLLSSERVGALATKRASRDYNINVLNDITFWMWVLSNGANEIFKINTENDYFDEDFVLASDYLASSLNYVENALELQDIDLNNDDDSDLDEEIASIAEEQLKEKIEK